MISALQHALQTVIMVNGLCTGLIVTFMVVSNIRKPGRYPLHTIVVGAVAILIFLFSDDLVRVG